MLGYSIFSLIQGDFRTDYRLLNEEDKTEWAESNLQCTKFFEIYLCIDKHPSHFNLVEVDSRQGKKYFPLNVFLNVLESILC